MEFGILFTSHPNTDLEPYPHRDVHARVTREILRADELGFDIAWLAEHHFSNEYGIMPDVFVYAGYLAALTQRIKIGTAVVTLPLANPLRVAENAAFVDILSDGRFVLGLGSGYRKYEFDGFGIDFDARRDIQEEALPLLIELFHKRRSRSPGQAFQRQGRRRLRAVPARGCKSRIRRSSSPAPPTARSRRRGAWASVCCCRPGRRSRSSRARSPPIAPRSRRRRRNCAPTRRAATWTSPAMSTSRRPTPRRGATAKPVIMRHLTHFSSGHTSGYLGTVSQGGATSQRDYDALLRDIILHGSPATVIEKIERLQSMTGAASLMLHYPPWYGVERALASLEMFAGEVIPKFRPPQPARMRA